MNTPENHHEEYPIDYEEDEEPESEASGNSNDYTYESSESYSSDCEQESNTEDQEPEAVYVPNLVKKNSLSICLPTDLPKDYDGMIDVKGMRGTTAATFLNDAIEIHVRDRRRYNKRHLYFSYNLPNTDKIDSIGKMETNVLAPVEVDEKGNAWFYVDVRFKQSIDKNSIPDEVLERIAYWTRLAYRDYDPYSLDDFRERIPTEHLICFLRVDLSNLDDLNFIRNCIL